MLWACLECAWGVFGVSLGYVFGVFWGCFNAFVKTYKNVKKTSTNNKTTATTSKIATNIKSQRFQATPRDTGSTRRRTAPPQKRRSARARLFARTDGRPFVRHLLNIFLWKYPNFEHTTFSEFGNRRGPNNPEDPSNTFSKLLDVFY